MMKKIIDSVEFILLKNDKILVEKRKASKRIDPNKICIPGGGIEKGETPEEALSKGLWKTTIRILKNK